MKNVNDMTDGELYQLSKMDCYGVDNPSVCRGYTYAPTGQGCIVCEAKRLKFIREAFGIKKWR